MIINTENYSELMKKAFYNIDKLSKKNKLSEHTAEVSHDGHLPEYILKAGGWKNQKEYNEWFEKVVIPQTEAMLKTAAGRKKLKKAGLIE